MRIGSLGSANGIAIQKEVEGMRLVRTLGFYSNRSKQGAGPANLC